MEAAQKKFRMLSVQPDLRVVRKVATFQLFFSVQGTGGSPTGSDPENRVGDQDTGSPGRPVLYIYRMFHDLWTLLQEVIS